MKAMMTSLEEMQKYCYDKMDNYQEEIIDVSKKLCFCFFSSHGIYYPNTVEEFDNRIIQNDYYDWKNIASSSVIRKKAGKYLFFRDVYKQFYVEGINKNINSIDSLIQLIKSKCIGYDVICCGSSAGGYIAALVGSRIQCRFVLSLSGQFSLYSYGAIDFMPLIKKHLMEAAYNQYYNIVPLVKAAVPIFYFFANMNEKDLRQYEEIKEIDNVFCFAFKSDKHASTLRGKDIPPILVKSVKQLIKVYDSCKGRSLTPKLFAIKLLGIYGYLWQKVCFKWKTIAFRKGDYGEK